MKLFHFLKTIFKLNPLIFPLSIFLLFYTFLGYSQEPLRLSLDDCIKIGLENNKTLKISESKVRSLEAKTKETDASLLPTLKFAGGYTRLSEVDPFEINTPFGKMSISPQLFDNFTLRLSATQPIFTGNRLRGTLNMVELQKNASENDYLSDISNITLDIKNAFWNLYKAIQYKKSIQSNIDIIKAHLNDIQNFYNNGMALLNDVLKVKVQLSNTEIMLLDADNAINISKIALNNVLGLPYNTNIEIVTNTDTSIQKLPVLSNLIDSAYALRNEVKSMEFRIKALESSVQVAKSGWYPQIFASANYYFNKPNQRIMPTRNEFIGTWDLGITISYDLFNWLTVPYQVEQAQSSLNQTVLGLQQLKDMISLEVSQNYLTLNKSIEKINASKSALEQAQENVRVTKEKFLNGLATNTDLLDAENNLLVSDINLINAYIDFELSKAKLEKSIGNNNIFGE